MNLEQFKLEIRNQTVEAMKAKDKVKLSTLRSVTTAITNLEKSNSIVDPTAVVLSLVKSRKDSVEQYIKANNQNLADIELAEIEILEQFLPKALDQSEISNIVKSMIDQLDHQLTIKDMGSLMNSFKQQYPGQDAALVSKIIKSYIQ